jgi:hypothetical protein
MSAHDGREVAVRLSIDGALYSVAGAVFYYHAPLMIDSVSPEGASSGLSGGLQISVSLHNGGGGLFGPSFDPDTVTVPASCAFGDVEVPAEFLPSTYQVYPFRTLPALREQLCNVASPPHSPAAVRTLFSGYQPAAPV